MPPSPEPQRPGAPSLCAVLLGAGLVGCAAGAGTATPEDSASTRGDSAGADDTATNNCESAPAVTWEGYAQGKFLAHCEGCHATDTPKRYGAPEAVTFDTEADIRTWKERIIVRMLEQEDMPPAGGLTDDEKYLLNIYLICGL
jgi:uncharacterized membrane protein